MTFKSILRATFALKKLLTFPSTVNWVANISDYENKTIIEIHTTAKLEANILNRTFLSDQICCDGVRKWACE